MSQRLLTAGTNGWVIRAAVAAVAPDSGRYITLKLSLKTPFYSTMVFRFNGDQLLLTLNTTSRLVRQLVPNWWAATK
jgi:hypothetical protein